MEERDQEILDARNKGLYYLQFSDKTEEEMRKKLAEQGFSPASVENAVKFLKECRYLNDENYARRYLEKNRNRKSEKQIKYELRQKGISRETAERVMEENPVDEERQIFLLLEKKKYAGEAAAREERQKMLALLMRKGFSYETIRTAMDHWDRGKER